MQSQLIARNIVMKAIRVYVPKSQTKINLDEVNNDEKDDDDNDDNNCGGNNEDGGGGANDDDDDNNNGGNNFCSLEKMLLIQVYH